VFTARYGLNLSIIKVKPILSRINNPSLPNTLRNPNCSLLLKFSDKSVACIIMSPCACYMSGPFHIFFDHLNNVWWRINFKQIRFLEIFVLSVTSFIFDLFVGFL